MNIGPKEKVFKVRPILDHFNKKFGAFFMPLCNTYLLDKAMEPYYGHHSMKQFIREKPIRNGFKFWCLTSPEGYMVKFHPYTGSNKTLGKSLGESVTENLCFDFVPNSSCIYMDNYFTSIPLMNNLSKNGLYYVGTIRSDRIEKAPLQDLKKAQRGACCSVEDKENNISLVRLNDNNQVTLVTNLKDKNLFEMGSCKRWKRKERKRANVPQPNLNQLYNKKMGGVDLFDKMRGLYRIIRSRKWYWPYFRFCPNGSIVNLWLLHRYVHKKVSLLNFTRQIVLALLASANMPSRNSVCPKTKKQVLDATTLDGKDHLVNKNATDTQRRCAACGKCTKFFSIKSNVGLHPDNCFVAYHK